MSKKKVAMLGIIGLLAAVAAVIGLIIQRFQEWREQRTKALLNGGYLADTTAGPVQYDRQGDGPVILLSHGGPGGYDQLPMLSELIDTGFQVLTPSRPGYLSTPLSTGHTMAEQADAAIALLDTLQIERVAVVGASAGGPLALELALRYPDRIWSLVMMAGVATPYQPAGGVEETLLGKFFLGDSGESILDFGMWLMESLSQHMPAQVAEMTIATESSLPPEKIQEIVKQMMADPAQVAWFQGLISSAVPLSIRKAGLDNDLEQLARLPDYQLAQVTCPTLVVHGRHDADVPYSHAEFVANGIAGARIVTQENNGHLIWLGNEWKETLPELVGFLQKHAPVAAIV